MFTETKGGDGAVKEEEEKERRRPGQRGREGGGWKRGEGPVRVSFQDGFYSYFKR